MKVEFNTKPLYLFRDIKTKIIAREICHTLSENSKMPCMSYDLPTKHCNVGSVLQNIKGSVCHGCYANKGRQAMPNCIQAQNKRFDTLNHPQWAEAMAKLITMDYFRWHSSGDIQGKGHLLKIYDVAKRTQSTEHWIPTKEKSIILDTVRSHSVPDNLIIRVSGAMVGGKPPIVPKGVHTSTVHTKAGECFGFECKAYTRANECGDCRACWDKSVDNVSYLMH